MGKISRKDQIVKDILKYEQILKTETNTHNISIYTMWLKNLKIELYKIILNERYGKNGKRKKKI